MNAYRVLPDVVQRQIILRSTNSFVTLIFNQHDYSINMTDQDIHNGFLRIMFENLDVAHASSFCEITKDIGFTCVNGRFHYWHNIKGFEPDVWQARGGCKICMTT